MEEFSFSYNVKKEIIEKINSKQKADACVLGLLAGCNNLSYDEISLLTENRNVVDFFERNVNRIIGNDDCTEISELGKKSGITLYRVQVGRENDRKKLLEFFGFGESRRLVKENLPKEKFLPFVTAGIFLACGSLNDPEKKYHMEFVLPNLDLCNDFGLFMIDNFGITLKYVKRRNSEIVYTKESEVIIDILTIMGATMSSIDVMNVKMVKQMRNRINRAVNCDNANINKTLDAAERLIDDIEVIDNTIGIGSLPDNLKEMATLRYENSDATLKDLAAMVSPPISRSGVNHRLKKISEIAENIRKEKGLKKEND